VRWRRIGVVFHWVEVALLLQTDAVRASALRIIWGK
jgi:hypothetical protein